MMSMKTLVAAQASFEIDNRSGMADATDFIAAGVDSPAARSRALDALSAVVAAGFTTLTMTWEQPKSGPRHLTVRG